MKAMDYLPDGEKGFRSRMYLGRQADKAENIEGTMDVFDLLNTQTEDNILIVTSETYMQLEDCDFGCNSYFIDGEYGYYDPAGNNFKPISEYGKTWSAIMYDDYDEAVAKAWQIMEKLKQKKEEQDYTSWLRDGRETEAVKSARANSFEAKVWGNENRYAITIDCYDNKGELKHRLSTSLFDTLREAAESIVKTVDADMKPGLKKFMTDLGML